MVAKIREKNPLPYPKLVALTADREQWAGTQAAYDTSLMYLVELRLESAIYLSPTAGAAPSEDEELATQVPITALRSSMRRVREKGEQWRMEEHGSYFADHYLG